MSEPSVRLADLDLHPNEASGLLRIGDDRLLTARGWDRGFWTVLDEVDVADCVAMIGHRAGAALEAGWEAQRLVATRTGDEGAADDAEAVASFRGWVYVLGSQHGGKDGPIRRREQWVARFREDAVDPDACTIAVEVRRTPFRLHRLLNDALTELDLLPMGERTRSAFVEATRERLAGSEQAEAVQPDDWTVNVEGAEFAPDGGLLLGLRYPVTADGCPVLARLRGIDRLITGGEPAVDAVWVLDAVGRGGELAGVRDLCLVGDVLHVVTGDLDSAGKGSVIRAEHPGGRSTVSTHFAVPLGPPGSRLSGEAVREFPDHPRIEGIAADADGRFYYVSDEEDAVQLRGTPLLTGEAGPS